MYHLTITGSARAERFAGLVTIEGFDADGSRFLFVAEHRQALDILNHVREGHDVTVDVPGWQIVGGPVAAADMLHPALDASYLV